MFWIKIVISGLIVAAVSELGKRYSLLAAILASLPLLSILAISWLYVESGDRQKVAELSTGILWAIIPSLIFFLILPVLLKTNLQFYLALGLSCCATFVGYLIYAYFMRKMGISF